MVAKRARNKTKHKANDKAKDNAKAKAKVRTPNMRHYLSISAYLQWHSKSNIQKFSAPDRSASSSYKPSSDGTHNGNDEEHLDAAEIRRSQRIRVREVSKTEVRHGTKSKALPMTLDNVMSAKEPPPEDTLSPVEQPPTDITSPKEQRTDNNESVEEPIPDDVQSHGKQPADDIQPPREQPLNQNESLGKQPTDNKEPVEEQRPNDITSVEELPPDDMESLREPHQKLKEKKYRNSEKQCQKLNRRYRKISKQQQKMSKQHLKTNKQYLREKRQHQKLKTRHRLLKDEHHLSTEQSATLKEQCQEMKAKYQKMKERVDWLEGWTAEALHKYHYLAADPSGWECRSHDYYEKEFFGLWALLRNWAERHAHEETTVLDSLPANYKKDLVKSLDGYCAQIDLEEILGALELGDIFGTEIVTMFLVKDCIERFFLNPFWYIVPHPGEGTEYDEEVLPRATRFGTGLHELLKKFDADGKEGFLAQSWRLWTARLCSTNVRADQSSFAKSMITRRNLMVEVMVKQVMAHELVKPLLKTSPDEKSVAIIERSLTRAYQHAAELSVRLSKDDHYVVFRNLHEIGEVFDESNPDMEADSSQAFDSDHLNGHRVMSMTYPAVYFCGGFISPDYRQRIVKANVFVEDKTTVTMTDST
ncbi:hypothetical protein CBS63078_2745 [Aspergillus niger]|uniref:Contig An03c0180, genomic contig n=5 Tax=Aspergillus niger TaxID=5061 RepID=A2QH61_ASPNC|nr:uncharacterized protein BO96DRAFT_389370 [Aspergillus niger CBS 101883]XP_059600332.1 uncharacterized protein An03g05710 [Aspergillus niger]KAI2822248.1 hypothetical protein CBS115989_2262 [Aspergillus niger]KAI2831514.1 hypothetical protein CBS133816_2429 [Aspergillus niger]KAI2855516.1 hypothetical protein CBS11232_4276 [Aspergillus niger]KAI2882379.1 hypothetical protein CBS115988_306 [Aspergillus niger]KAI2884203.1 hypothetical protein CBS11852_8795 [Aspergillus niger]